MEFVGANSFARNCLNVRMNSHPHLLLFLGSGLGYYDDELSNSGRFPVSIPFHSGLGYYLSLIYEATDGRTSQSLFIQGWGTTGDYDQIKWQDAVSIPFHSGLGYYASGSCNQCHHGVSIPFHSGLGYYPESDTKCEHFIRLNPFSFRAGVLRLYPGDC